MRALADWPQPPYPSSSAFRFAFDGAAPRDVADCSAVAQELGVLSDAITEQKLEVGPTVGARTMPHPPPTHREAPGTGTRGSSVITAESLLTVPSSIAAREKAVQGCRALVSGWHAEAEELFCDGATLVPTDPFLWYGAGLAASRLDLSRGADHLERSSRYLLRVDPAGSTYIAILAASLRQRGGDLRAARRILDDQLAEVDARCPTLSLHLARLGPDRKHHLTEALDADPLLEADVAVLGLATGDGSEVEEVLTERRRRTEGEIGALEHSIAELRTVDGGPPWSDEPGDDARQVGDDTLPLARLEVRLCHKIRICQAEIDAARRMVQDRERARRAKEAEVKSMLGLADADLQHVIAVPFFLAAVGIALAVLMVFVVGQYARAAMPSLNAPIVIGAWIAQAALAGLAIILFLRAWWPHRSYGRARRAKTALPQLEWEAAQLRESEFDVRRRFNTAGHDAGEQIEEVIGRRTFLAPHRPGFDST